MKTEMVEKLKGFIDGLQSAEAIERFSGEMLIAQVIGEAIALAKGQGDRT